MFFNRACAEEDYTRAELPKDENTSDKLFLLDIIGEFSEETKKLDPVFHAFSGSGQTSKIYPIT